MTFTEQSAVENYIRDLLCGKQPTRPVAVAALAQTPQLAIATGLRRDPLGGVESGGGCCFGHCVSSGKPREIVGVLA